MLEFALENLPIIACGLLATGLLIAEIFLPGFGIVGITGILLEVVSVVLMFIRYGAPAALGTAVLSLAVVGITISIAIRVESREKAEKQTTASAAEALAEPTDMDALLNREGLALTAIDPTGMGEFDGVKLSVTAADGGMPAGARIRIVKVEGARLLVCGCEA